MITIHSAVTYDKTLTAADETRLAEHLLAKMHHFLAMEACKIMKDDGEFFRSIHLNITTSSTVNHITYGVADHVCPETGRLAMTVEDAYARDDSPDRYFWMYDARRAELSMDPWREITGIDCSVDEKTYTLDYAVSASVDVTPDFVIYMQRNKQED